MILRVVAIIATVVILMAVGYLSVRAVARSLAAQLSFADEFLTKLHSYYSSHGKDPQAYGWLTRNSVRMQRELGGLGILEFYKPAGADYALRNVQVVVNILTQLNQWLSDSYADLLAGPAREAAQTLNDAIVRNVGVLAERQQAVERQLRNPVTLLREGVQQVLLLPVRVLSWLGIVGSYSINRLAARRAIVVVSGVITLVGLVSAIVTIVVGWHQFVAIIVGWFAKL